eukprot:64353_1
MATSLQQEKDHQLTFGSNVINTQVYGINITNLVDINSMINIFLLLVSCYGLFYSSSMLLSFTWLLFLIFEDILFWGFGISIFSTETGIKRGYQFGHIFLEELSGHGRDLGFNLYENNINKSYKQSQVDKFEYMISHLGLKKGMKLLDCGCGYGDWLNYCKKKK